MASSDVEYDVFCKGDWKSEGRRGRVREIQQDIFQMSSQYSLGHCVAEDFRMSQGIAVGFKQIFGEVARLKGQRQTQGGLAFLRVPVGNGVSRFIYYLVTKRRSCDKPTYLTLWASLRKLRRHICDNKVTKLAIPRIGCGLDKLRWQVVKEMLEFLFYGVDVDIVVCK